MHLAMSIAVMNFHIPGLKHPPWLVLGGVLAAAMLSRSLVFVIAMFRDKGGKQGKGRRNR